MTAYEPIAAGCREVVEIDALMRALRNLRHWSATAAARRDRRDDMGRRLYAAAAGLRDEARADSLHAAYALFEIDAIHDAWLAADGRRG
jgi:hypothetical protein